MLRRLLNPLLALLGPRMRYGVRSGDGAWRPHSRARISSPVVPWSPSMKTFAFMGVALWWWAEIAAS